MVALLATTSDRWQRRRFSPIASVYMANSDGLHESSRNLEDEPNEALPQPENSEDVVFETPPAHHHFGPATPSGVLDESRVCLLDTACTSCMHSTRWREAFQRTLPAGMTCTPTATTKAFHFADGSTTNERAIVWRIPIFICGHHGEVFSAEIKSGGTPLLLSIAAMDALDMVLHVRKQMVQVNTLGVEVPMLVTRSKHVAIEICYNEEHGIKPFDAAQPRSVSEREDLLIYYGEEASMILLSDLPYGSFSAKVARKEIQPCLEPRGLRCDDTLGLMQERRHKELMKTARQIKVADGCGWL